MPNVLQSIQQSRTKQSAESSSSTESSGVWRAGCSVKAPASHTESDAFRYTQVVTSCTEWEEVPEDPEVVVQVGQLVTGRVTRRASTPYPESP